MHIPKGTAVFMKIISMTLLLAFSLQAGLAVRHGIQELQEDLLLESGNKQKRWAGCPDECQECCVASFFGVHTKTSEFKCLLKNRDQLPARECSQAAPRISQHKQHKTECKFTDAENEDKAHELLGQCSSKFECCCSANDDWSEVLQLPLGTEEQKIIRYKSPTRKTNEVYVQLPRRTRNNKGPCVQAKFVAYQTAESWVKGVDVKNIEDDKHGCCVRTEKDHKGYTHHFGHKKGRSHGHVEYEACAQWESLYSCSNNSGVSESCINYMRIPQKPGTCFGDATTQLPPRGCPAGYTDQIVGAQCECTEDCG